MKVQSERIQGGYGVCEDRHGLRYDEAHAFVDIPNLVLVRHGYCFAAI